jgi:ribosome biogenesis GTPase
VEKGVVIKSTGRHYKVLDKAGNVIECSIRGKLRTRQFEITNPVAVGDHVLIEIDKLSGTGLITDVLDRKNYILRKSSNLSRQSQIIAANIDQAVLMITIKLPETAVEFIDRFLMTAEAYRIPAILIINKTDLYDEEDWSRLSHIESVYSIIGYKCITLSLRDKRNMEEVITLLKDKITLISGNSGVGKTSLLNTLNPDLNLKTGEISGYHKQGKHITTFPEMHLMPFGGYVIDTPGIRGFGIVDMDRNEIYHFFPEIFRISAGCRYHNCLHLDEPGCAVREAIDTGEIDLLRYRSYLNILEGDDRKYR